MEYPLRKKSHTGLLFFLKKVTGWTVFRELRIAQPQILPIVPSGAEVKSVLAAVREPR